MPQGDNSAQAMLGTRYAVYGEIASGGMASVQYGRLLGPRGFARAVAIKRMHPHFAREPGFVSMFVDEARLCARLVHANIIPTLDVIETPGELALVMEYVHGESLATLLQLSAAAGEHVPVRVACSLIASVLYGLHAAHETRGDDGQPLDIVHRDVSPENILVGADGVPRVLDFGIAKAIGRLRSTPSGEIKGKLLYIAPEQLHGATVDRRADVYGASVVLWETLAGRLLFDGANESAVVHKVLHEVIAPPSAHQPAVPQVLDAIVLRGLNRDVGERFASAREMASCLERDVGLASQSEVSDWLQALAGTQLAARARLLARMQKDGALSEDATLNGQAVPVSPQAAAPTERVPLVAGRTTRVHLSKRGRLSLAAVVFVAAALWLWGRGTDKAAWVVVPRPAAPPPPPLATAKPQPSAAAPADSTTLSPPPAAPPLETGSDVALPSVEDSRPQPRERRPPSASAAAGPAKVEKQNKRQCTPYFYVDGMGIRRPKPGCL